MSHGSGSARTIGVEGLVTGRGRGLAARRRARRHGHRRRPRDLRATPLLRGPAGGTALHRGARHHGPHLRHLPGRLPDERVRGHGGRLRRRRSTTGWRPCGGSSTAASGSRATPCTSTCCTRRTSSAAPTRSSWPSATGPRCERGLGLKRTGNLIMETVGGRAVHPVNVRVGGFYRAPDPDAVAALAEPAAPGPRRRAGHRRVGLAASTSPTCPATTASWPCATRAATPSRRAGRPRRTAWTLSPAEFAELVVEEHVARSTALHARLAGRDPYLTGPLARYALNAGTLPAAGRRGRRRRPGWVRCAPTRSRASWCGPSSWCSPVTRRWRWSRRTILPIPPPTCVSRPGARRAGTGRDRGAPGSAPPPLRDRRRTAPSFTPASCRRPRRTSSPSRPTCAASSRAGSTWTTTTSSGAASRPCATTTPASPAPPTSSTSRW